MSTAAHPAHFPDRSKGARGKLVTIEEIARIAAEARAHGKTVVMAHGVFDLLHLGHVRHFEAAKREGDLLLVTLTADRYVNKGPGRPVFPEALRAEMVAAVEYVDCVAVNHAPSAEHLIQALQPHVYVKGSDYAVAEDDVTGKISAERHAVEEHGGRVVFTHDLTFSSSNLINRYLNIYEPSLQRYLEERRGGEMLDQLLKAIEGIAKLRVLFVGDAIVDEYSYVHPMAKAPKENIIATQFMNRELFAGGVIAAAKHLSSFCRQVDILTCLGTGESHEEMIRDGLPSNMNMTAVWREAAPTTRKARFIDSYTLRKLFEVYWMDDSSLPASVEAQFNTLLSKHVGEYDLVVITDFGHGLLGPSSISVLTGMAKFLAVNTQTNSGNFGFNMMTKYPRADYVSIDTNEARLAMHDKFTDIPDLVAGPMAETIDCPRIIVTQGKHGCVTYERGGGMWRVPALTSTIVDTVGAGDAFFAITAPLIAQGIPMELAGFVGNAAGALKVGIVGHRTSVNKPALIKFITALLK